MTARDNARTSLDTIIDKVVNLAQSPHFKDLDESEFRYYMDRLAGSSQRSLQFDLFAIYEEERKRMREASNVGQ